MLKRLFIGSYSHFTINYFVKMYITAESLLWSAWSFINPVFGIFVIQKIPGAGIQDVAFAQSLYLVTRVICELISGRFLLKANDKRKLMTSIIGVVIVAVGFMGFVFTTSLPALYVFNFFTALGMGISTPAKNALFSLHLDKNKEATEYGISDSLTYLCMALATALGGFIVVGYGYSTLFIIASLVTLIGIIPYALCLKRDGILS